MKKILTLALSFIIIVSSCFTTVLAYDDNIKVTINGVSQNYDVMPSYQ